MSDEKKDYEIRYYLHGELLCPNPIKTYKNTRTYEQMRQEYELQTCTEFTEEEILDLYLKLKRL